MTIENVGKTGTFILRRVDGGIEPHKGVLINQTQSHYTIKEFNGKTFDLLITEVPKIEWE
jgi:hypothetical protein